VSAQWGQVARGGYCSHCETFEKNVKGRRAKGETDETPYLNQSKGCSSLCETEAAEIRVTRGYVNNCRGRRKGKRGKTRNWVKPMYSWKGGKFERAVGPDRRGKRTKQLEEKKNNTEEGKGRKGVRGFYSVVVIAL